MAQNRSIFFGFCAFGGVLLVLGCWAFGGVLIGLNFRQKKPRI
jgi:hypothetical protein